jgi:uncharacterized pyridoxal phosphate-containing UPF0001 family protein
MSEPEMLKIDPARAKELVSQLKSVQERLNAVAKGRPVSHDAFRTQQEIPLTSIQVRLVAVSKLKPANDILALHQIGHDHFGENYAQELCQKAEILPRTIQWHFIGGLQSSLSQTMSSLA